MALRLYRLFLLVLCFSYLLHPSPAVALNLLHEGSTTRVENDEKPKSLMLDAYPDGPEETKGTRKYLTRQFLNWYRFAILDPELNAIYPSTEIEFLPIEDTAKTAKAQFGMDLSPETDSLTVVLARKGDDGELETKYQIYLNARLFEKPAEFVAALNHEMVHILLIRKKFEAGDVKAPSFTSEEVAAFTKSLASLKSIVERLKSGPTQKHKDFANQIEALIPREEQALAEFKKELNKVDK
jgi:hypothetical protein